MDLIVICNGLGNQMSQYGLYLNKKQQGQSVRYLAISTEHNGIELQRLFGVETEWSLWDKFLFALCRCGGTEKKDIVSRCLRWIANKCGITVVREDYDYSFHPNVVKGVKGLRLINGGWHHYSYYTPNEDAINQAYRFPEFKNKKNRDLVESLDTENAVAIHIRRGDFLKAQNYEMFGSVCGERYYLDAINRITQDIPSPTFYVFSNDMEWSSKLMEGYKAVFVDWNKGLDSWADMALMSKFKNIIIANSTFSWWAAWLGEDEKKVICPQVFINTDKTSGAIYPDKWIRV